MIFNVPGHIDMIRNGLDKGDALARIDPNLYQTMPLTIIKTQTRRLNRGIYQIGKNYAVQRKRGVKAESDIRIVMDSIRYEQTKHYLTNSQGSMYLAEIYLSEDNAKAEGGYKPDRYERVFRELNLKWDGWNRWAFEFHVIEVQK